MGLNLNGTGLTLTGTAPTPASSVTPGTTTVVGGTASGILWNNAGVLATGPATTNSSGGLNLFGTATFSDGSTFSSGGLAMAGGKTITASGGGIVGVGFGLDQNTVGDIVSRSAGRIGFVSGTVVSAAPDAYFTRTAVGVLKANSYIGTVSTVVASLPSAATAGQGARGIVTDANANTFNSIVAGGGANIVPVFSDGTNWRIG